MAFKNLLVQLDDTKACDRRVAAAVARQFREVLDGREEPEAGDKHLNEPVPIASFSNGLFTATRVRHWSPPVRPRRNSGLEA